MELTKDKRGYTTLMLFFIIFAGLGLLIILGIVIFGASLVDQAFLEIDFTLENISFNETYQAGLGQALVAAQTTVPSIIGIGTLLGMVLACMLVSYKTRKIGRLWVILDFAIIIVAEMIAVAVTVGFTGFMNSTPAFLSIYSNNIPLAAKFILNLPIIVPTIGALIIVATHFLGKEEEEDEVFR